MKGHFRTARLVRCAALAATISLLSVAPAYAVDRAVVVGVNRYPQLADATLKGSVPDAQLIGKILREKYGFETQVLTDDQATRQGIIAALKSVGTADRFVFYFAGHGERSSERGAIILPHDALQNSERNDLPAKELNDLVRAVPAKSRTVLLDSCFSGAMARAFSRLGSRHKNLRVRYYDRSKDLVLRSDEKPDVDPNRADDNDHLQKDDSKSGVCYFTASRENERAGEDEFDGQPHGIFTNFLVQSLAGAKEKWSDVQPAVARKVADYMEDEQHPTLSPGFVDVEVFASKDTTPKPALTFWDFFNGDNVNRSQVELTMSPRSSTVKVGESVAFFATVGGSGYLVLLEKGTSGNINLLYPTSNDADDARMEAGKVKRIPPQGFHFEPDAPGVERLRALLLTSREATQQLLDSFRKSRSVTRSGLSKDLRVKPDPQSTAYTSDLIFEVAEAEQK